MRSNRITVSFLVLTASFLFFYEQTHITAKPLEKRPWEKFLAESENIQIKYPEISRLRLNNNVELLYLQTDILPKVSLKITIEGGLVEEETNKIGLTGIWGRGVTYSGSKKFDRDTLSSILEKNASDFNFSHNISRASFRLTALSRFFESDLKIILEVLNHPRFDIQDIKLLQQQAVQSLKEVRQNPASLARLGSSLAYWKGHPRNKQATNRTILAITRDDLLAKQAEMWKANRLKILVAGDFDLANLKSILNKNIPSKNPRQVDLSPALRVSENILKDRSDQSYHILKDIPQSVILWKGRGLKHHDREYFAWKIFDFILGGSSFNSYLTQEIRVKRGWVYSIYSTYNTDKYQGNITIFAQTQNQNLPKLIREVEKILKSPEEYISLDRIKQAKRSIQNRFVFLYSTHYDFLNRINELESEGLDKDHLRTFLDNIEKTTYEQVIQIAKQYYQPSKLFKLIVGPKDIKIPGKKSILKLEE